MSTQVQYRRGTATENNAFTGALAEITVDTTNWTLRVHDGATAGGGGNVATVAYVTAQLAALSANAITFGTSNVQIPSSGGNVRVNVGGTANVAVFNSTGANIAGTLGVTGNITGGNLSGTSISGTLTTAAQTNITSVGTLSSLSATGNVSGGNITTAGQLVSSIVTGTAPMVIASTTKVTNLNVEQVDGFHADQAGTVSTIVVRDSSGYANVAGLINSGANGVGNIGSSTTYYNTVFAKATSAQYADLAEMYVADKNYAPGTVVEFGGEFEITQTTTSHSTAVAGIISTNPSYLMNSTQNGEHVLPVALTGRVPCRVQGPVRKGDVLVSSSIAGVAQRIGVNWQPGCVIGKSMENISTSEIQTIEVAVGRT